jgi:ribosome recycling factor
MSYNFSTFDETLQEATDWLKKEYSQISTGRANPSLLDSIQVDSYGTHQPIKNMAAITVEEARTLRITPWDKSQIKDIEKAIRDSELPFALAIDDAGLRASLPQLTEENKRDVVKLLKKKLEEARIRVRQARNDTEKDIEESDLSEDEEHREKETMQTKVTDANKKLDELFDTKEADIMKV